MKQIYHLAAQSQVHYEGGKKYKMDRLLYIANGPLNVKSGHGWQKKMHRDMMTSYFGENMWCCLFDCNDTPINKQCIVAGQNSAVKKILAVICGYAPCINVFLIRKIIQVIRQERINIIFADHSVYGKLLGKIRKEFPDIYIIVYFPDVEKQLMGEQLKDARLVRKASLLTMIRNEKLTIRFSNRQLVLNNRDKKLFEKFYKMEPTDIVPVSYKTINHIGSCEKHNSGVPLNILFAGVDYYPNVNGIQWFIDNVSQEICNKYTLTIVGRGMEKYKDRWEKNSHRINVMGTVDDLSPYYVNSDVVIAPIFEGGGMKVKTGEALSYGKMFIGTDESLVGYLDNADKIINKYIFICNTAIEFEEAINYLIDKEFYKYNEELYKWLDNEYSFDSNFAKIKRIISDRKTR